MRANAAIGGSCNEQKSSKNVTEQSIVDVRERMSVAYTEELVDLEARGRR